jgi:hypothetical protein
VGRRCDPRCCPGAQPRCGTSWHGGVAVPFGGHGTFFVRRGGRPWALPSQAASMPIDKNCVLRAGTGLARHAMRAVIDDISEPMSEKFFFFSNTVPILYRV